MCQTCEAVMMAVSDRGDGATAYAWDRAEAALKAWRAMLSDDVEFDNILEESQAWCDHMTETTTRNLASTRK